MAVCTVRNIRRELRKRIKLGNGTGFTTVPDGFESADIEVTANLEMIARVLGFRAMANKSGRAKYLSGLITVKVLDRSRSTT